MNRTLRRTLAAGAVAGTLVAAARWWRRSRRRLSFWNRTVLLTGGSRGLGLVLARELIRRGARVAVCARDAEELLRAESELTARGGEVSAHICDVTDRTSVVRVVREVQAVWGSIDVLINNAGIIQVGPMESMTILDYQAAIATHLYGPVHTTEAVLPLMRAHGGGRIVNIASIGGVVSVPHLLPYSASKFALVGYSLGLRAELAKDGIVVTTICPGLMRTGSPRNATFKGRHQAEYAWFKISSSLPVASMSAEAAACRILDACEYGDALRILGPSNLAAKLYALCPDLATDALAIVNRWLPAPGGIGVLQRKGYESESNWSESGWTAATDIAAATNNESGELAVAVTVPTASNPPVAAPPDFNFGSCSHE
jgi:NAD(P)-dependent dehydrogenase (short-subunit alcohol dehydrogenase family)